MSKRSKYDIEKFPEDSERKFLEVRKIPIPSEKSRKNPLSNEEKISKNTTPRISVKTNLQVWEIPKFRGRFPKRLKRFNKIPKKPKTLWKNPRKIKQKSFEKSKKKFTSP